MRPITLPCPSLRGWGAAPGCVPRRAPAAAVTVALFAPDAALALARPRHAVREWAAWPRGPLVARGSGGSAAGAAQEEGEAAREEEEDAAAAVAVAAGRMVLVVADSRGGLRVLETACLPEVV